MNSGIYKYYQQHQSSFSSTLSYPNLQDKPLHHRIVYRVISTTRSAYEAGMSKHNIHSQEITIFISQLNNQLSKST